MPLRMPNQQPVLHFILRVLSLAAIAWLLACALLYVVQRQLLYMPQASGLKTAELRLPSEVGAQVVAVQERIGSAALIYFGGNAEDVSWILGELAQHFPERALYLPYYRGYGGSAGEPSQAALTADALALFDYVQQKHAQVAVIGRSLGAGVAMQVAAARPVSKLALVTPFASMRSVAAYHYPWLPVSWLLKDQFDSVAVADQVRAPTLVLLAGRDRVVPASSSQQLIVAFGTRSQVRAFEQADHDDIAIEPDYFPTLKAFFADFHG